LFHVLSVVGRRAAQKLDEETTMAARRLPEPPGRRVPASSGTRLLAAAAAVASLAGAGPAANAHAVGADSATGNIAEIRIVDRDTGSRLPIYWHEGRRYVAGTPGSRYSIEVYNRTGGRILAVVSVDGVNAVTGETASWTQNGYVFAPWQRWEIRGWRKSSDRVAAFEFTSLPDSYAARTGRPDNVGVIGIATFREARRAYSAPPVPLATYRSQRDGAGSDTRIADARGTAGTAESESAGVRAGAAPPVPASPPAAPSASAPSGVPQAERAGQAQSAPSPGAEAHAQRREAAKLGTGHGRSESSRVTFTDFERARPAPDEVLTIHYDSRENLIALGVIPTPRRLAGPDAFPGDPRFVPDPPR
jgi:hypothetical protein